MTTGAPPTFRGTLTDYEGSTARINNEPLPMTGPAAHWCADRLKKGMKVAYYLTNGKISKIWKDESAQRDPDTAAKMQKAGFGADTRSREDIAKEQQEYNAAQAAATIAKEKAEGAQRMAENAAYLKDLTAGKKQEPCTSPESPAVHLPTVIPVQQPHPAPISYSEDEMLLLRNVIAKGCTEPEFKLLMYMANTYGLDPLLKQIWAVKRNENTPALIFAGRDGMLAIAHRSGHFDGMQSGVIYEGEGKEKKPVSAWCEIWRNDMSHSFRTEVPFSEYNTGFGVWRTNPSAMILKVAEAVCLRKAFSVSGLYAPEEIEAGGA